MNDTPPRVTKKMFLEEYTRQLVKRSDMFKDVRILGKALARANRALNNRLTYVERVGHIDWVNMSEPARETCEILGIRNPTLHKLRRLPKE